MKIGVFKGREKRLQPSLPEVCDDGTIASKRCRDLDTNFYKNFRTIDGQCNNVENPILGSSFSKLSRLLPAENEKFKMPTFFEKPSGRGKFICNFRVKVTELQNISMEFDRNFKN